MLHRVSPLQHIRQAQQDVVECGPVDRVVVEARVHHLAVRGRGGGGHRWEALAPGVVVLAGPLALGQDLGAHKRGLAQVQLPGSTWKQVMLVSMARPEKWEGGGPGFQVIIIITKRSGTNPTQLPRSRTGTKNTQKQRQNIEA